LIILPGTKSTVADLGYLRTAGRDREVIHRFCQGTPVIGICGGYQMLGSAIHDPDGIESTEPITAGLALLPVSSRFLHVKSTHQIRARVAHKRGILARADDDTIQGYEIHMGQTDSANITQPFELIERSSQPCAALDGAMSADGNIMGTYIHGLFHNDRLRHAILSELASRKGHTFTPRAPGFSINEQYDRLAAHVRRNLNMGLIREFLDQG
jgi:adenosylcobyric acid synthase